MPNNNQNVKSEVFNPKLDDGDTINSWGLDPQPSLKHPESTLDTYLNNPIST